MINECVTLARKLKYTVFVEQACNYSTHMDHTHEDAELMEGALEGEEIICPLHGARFSIVTGAVLSPPAYENLSTFPVRVSNGWVEVDAEAELDIA